MKLRKFNQVMNEDRFGFDDIDQFDDSAPKGKKDLSWLDDDMVDKYANNKDAKKAAENDLKSDPGYKKLVDDLDELNKEFDLEKDDFKKKNTKRTKLELSGEQEDVVKELTYLLRKMIKNAGIDNCYIDNDGYDISIQFIFQKVDKMKSIMRVINTLKKINDDILIQYDPEIEMWETTGGEPMLTVDFYYEANKKGYKKDVEPF